MRYEKTKESEGAIKDGDWRGRERRYDKREGRKEGRSAATFPLYIMFKPIFLCVG